MVDKVSAVTSAHLMNLESTGKHFEVLNGEILEKPMAGRRHGMIEVNLIMLIASYVKANHLGQVYTGDTTFVLKGEPGNIEVARLPDVSFVSAKRENEENLDDFHYLAPDLAIEVISPSERQAKVNDYLEYGTKQVWLVYPETNSVIVQTKGNQETTYQSQDTISPDGVIEGLAIKVSEIFS